MKPKSTRLSAICPNCESTIRLNGRIQLGDEVTCWECDTPLQVVSLYPPELDYLWDDAWNDIYSMLEDLYEPDADTPEEFGFGSNGHDAVSGDEYP